MEEFLWAFAGTKGLKELTALNREVSQSLREDSCVKGLSNDLSLYIDVSAGGSQEVFREERPLKAS